jgi:hypothetical protein
VLPLPSIPVLRLSRQDSERSEQIFLGLFILPKYPEFAVPLHLAAAPGVFRLGLHESSDSATVLMLARPVYCNFDLSLGAPGWACVCSQVPVPGEVRPQDQRVSDVKNLFFGISFRLLTPVARFPVSSSPCSISCAQELTLLVTSWGPRSSHPTRRLVTVRWALIMFVGSSLVEFSHPSAVPASASVHCPVQPVPVFCRPQTLVLVPSLPLHPTVR